MEKASRYNRLTALLSSKVLAMRNSFDKDLKTLEHEHFKKHHHLPDRSNSVYAELLSRRNHAKAVLRNMNIVTDLTPVSSSSMYVL